MEHNQNAFDASAPESATDEPGSPANQAALSGDGAFAGGAPAPLDFDPVATRHRIDGLTPEKQREYVEALADSGLARYAAARIGVSEQAVNRLRRRADARSFNLACEAGQRLGARRLHSIAWERAIEGTIRRHYYHGELKSEERVYDNRLLVYLLGRTEHLLADDDDETRAVAEHWQPFVEAMEQGLPAPVPSEAEESSPPDDEPWDDDRDEDGLFTSIGASEEPDGWRTEFPPPAGFDGEEEGRFGDAGYRRTLSRDEQAVIDAAEAHDRAEEIARETARRDRFFGFEGGSAEGKIFSPREAELYETSGPGAPEPPTEAGERLPPIAEPAGEDDKESP